MNMKSILCLATVLSISSAWSAPLLDIHRKNNKHIKNQKCNIISHEKSHTFFPLPTLSLSGGSQSDLSQLPGPQTQPETDTAPQHDDESTTTKYNKLSLSKTNFTFLLSFLSGSYEAISLIRYKCFANMMTGNTVRCWGALCQGATTEGCLYASMILSYVLGGSLYRILEKSQSNNSSGRSLTTRRLVLCISSSLFLLSDAIGRWRDLSRLPVMALSFGLLNAAANVVTGTVTNAVTGHWTKVGVGLGDWMSGGKRNDLPWVSLGSVTSFVSGLFLANTAYRFFHSSRLLFPPLGVSLAVLYSMAWLWYDHTCPDNA